METGLRTITSELGLFGLEKKRLRGSKQDPECAVKRTLGGLRAGGQAFTSNSCVTSGPFLVSLSLSCYLFLISSPHRFWQDWHRHRV